MVELDGINFSIDTGNKLKELGDKFRSKDYSFIDYKGYGTEKLREFLRMAIKEIGQDRNWPKGYTYDWRSRRNIYMPGENDSPHYHPEPDLIAVFYVDIPENSGDILFFETRGAVGPFWRDKWESKDKKGRTGRVYHRIAPKPGMLVLFPNYLFHEVETNLSDDHRTSMIVDIKIFTDSEASP